MEKFEELNYNELRSRCKDNGLKANGKKGDLISRLKDYFKNAFTSTENNDDRKENEMLTDDEESMKDFKVIDSVPSTPHSSRSLSHKAVKGSQDDPTEILNKEKSPLMNVTMEYITDDEDKKSPPKRITTPITPSSKFRRAHNSFYGKMESIDERQARIRALHAKHEASVPDTFKRLATPKRKTLGTEEIKKGFDFSNAPTDVSGINCNFIKTPVKSFNAEANKKLNDSVRKLIEKKKELSTARCSHKYKRRTTLFQDTRTLNDRDFKKHKEALEKEAKNAKIVKQKRELAIKIVLMEGREEESTIGEYEMTSEEDGEYIMTDTDEENNLISSYIELTSHTHRVVPPGIEDYQFSYDSSMLKVSLDHESHTDN
uniref:SAP domain-containing protein n=1 Tax=Parastrongyloides trichosuri TaxID=131310 RepID=A0A0N4ZGH8_PARTI